MKEYVPKPCKNPNCDKLAYSAMLPYCGKKCKDIVKPANIKLKSPINKVSAKKKLDDIIYKSERIKFLMLPENKICPITKKEATTIHHKKGRLGSLYLDKTFWVALSMEGHEFVEKNPEWAKENGYSLNRLSND
jgi:hypothetical protein